MIIRCPLVFSGSTGPEARASEIRCSEFDDLAKVVVSWIELLIAELAMMKKGVDLTTRLCYRGGETGLFSIISSEVIARLAGTVVRAFNEADMRNQISTGLVFFLSEFYLPYKQYLEHSQLLMA